MSSINRHARSAEEYDSDNLDEPARPSPPKKQKMTKAQEAKAKAAAKKKKEAEERDEEDDAYTALSKSAFNGPSKPPNGSMIDCVKCEQKFTVVCSSHNI
jgi:DNA repair protein RAD7